MIRFVVLWSILLLVNLQSSFAAFNAFGWWTKKPTVIYRSSDGSVHRIGESMDDNSVWDHIELFKPYELPEPVDWLAPPGGHDYDLLDESLAMVSDAPAASSVVNVELNYNYDKETGARSINQIRLIGLQEKSPSFNVFPNSLNGTWLKDSAVDDGLPKDTWIAACYDDETDSGAYALVRVWRGSKTNAIMSMRASHRVAGEAKLVKVDEVADNLPVGVVSHTCPDDTASGRLYAYRTAANKIAVITEYTKKAGQGTVFERGVLHDKAELSALPLANGPPCSAIIRKSYDFYNYNYVFAYVTSDNKISIAWTRIIKEVGLDTYKHVVLDVPADVAMRTGGKYDNVVHCFGANAKSSTLDGFGSPASRMLLYYVSAKSTIIEVDFLVEGEEAVQNATFTDVHESYFAPNAIPEVISEATLDIATTTTTISTELPVSTTPTASDASHLRSACHMLFFVSLWYLTYVL